MQKYKNKRISGVLFEKKTGVSLSTILRHFGSWNNFMNIMKEDKITEVTKVEHTNEELLKMYEKFSIKIGKGDTGATQDEVNDGFIYNSEVLERRFGSLNNMRNLLGFTITHPGNSIYTKEILKKMLIEKYEEYGRRLTQRELTILRQEENFPLLGVFLRHFQTTKM